MAGVPVRVILFHIRPIGTKCLMPVIKNVRQVLGTILFHQV